MRDKLIELIEKGEIRTALEEMKKVVRIHLKTESEFEDEVSQLLSRFNKIEGGFITEGIIPGTLYFLEYNKIIKGAREILYKLPQEILMLFPKVENTVERVGGSKQNNYHATVFFISPYHALTSYGAVQELFKGNPDKVEVRLYFNSKKKVITGQIDREDCHPSLNIALIEVSSQESSSANFVEWDTFSPASTDRFFIYGFPHNVLEGVGFFLSLKEVIKPTFNMQEFILQLETGEKTPISLEGMRGAPLMSCSTGKICGIVTKTDDKNGEITATPSFEITKRHNKIKEIIHAPLKASLGEKEKCVGILRDYLIQNYTLKKLKTIEKVILDLLHNKNGSSVNFAGKSFKKEVFTDSLAEVLISKTPKPFVDEHNNFLKDLIDWLFSNHFTSVRERESKVILLYFYLFYLYMKIDREVFLECFEAFDFALRKKFKIRTREPWKYPEHTLGMLTELKKMLKDDDPVDFDKKIYMFLLIEGELSLKDLENYQNEDWFDSMMKFTELGNFMNFSSKEIVPNDERMNEFQEFIDKKITAVLGLENLKKIYILRKQAKRKKFDWHTGQFFVSALALMLKENDDLGSVCDAAFNYSIKQ